MSDCRLPNIHKILIIRNDGIGDLLNSTPAIAMLRQNYADAEIAVPRPTVECADLGR